MTALLQSLGFEASIFSSLMVWGLIFIRIFFMLLLNPFMGSRAVPGRARVALSMVMALFLYYAIQPVVPDDFDYSFFNVVALFFKEAFLGFAIGFITSIIFYAIEAAGRIIDLQRGGANAQTFVPQLGQVSIFGLFLFWLGIAVFLEIGGHRQFLQAFFGSFQAIPLLEFPKIQTGFSAFIDFFIVLSSSVLLIAIKLSAPVLITILLVDLVLGIANKMAPQINVFELGFSIKGYMAPLILWVSATFYILGGEITKTVTLVISTLTSLLKIFSF